MCNAILTRFGGPGPGLEEAGGAEGNQSTERAGEKLGPTNKVQRRSYFLPFRLLLVANSIEKSEMILYAHVIPICGVFTSIFIQVSGYNAVILLSQKARSIVV